MSSHTAEYYEHKLAVAQKEIRSYRDMAKQLVGANGHHAYVAQLQAKIEQLETIASTMFFELKLYAPEETHGMTEYKKASCG